MNPETINSVIDNLANKLAVPAGKLMEVLPRLGYGKMTIVTTEVIFLCVGLCFFLLGLIKKIDNTSLPKIGVAIIIISLLFLAFDFANLLFWLHDPEAWALDYMLKMLR